MFRDQTLGIASLSLSHSHHRKHTHNLENPLAGLSVSLKYLSIDICLEPDSLSPPLSRQIQGHELLCNFNLQPLYKTEIFGPKNRFLLFCINNAITTVNNSVENRELTSQLTLFVWKFLHAVVQSYSTIFPVGQGVGTLCPHFQHFFQHSTK